MQHIGNRMYCCIYFYHVASHIGRKGSWHTVGLALGTELLRVDEFRLCSKL